jgi:hypothetical protein
VKAAGSAEVSKSKGDWKSSDELEVACGASCMSRASRNAGLGCEVPARQGGRRVERARGRDACIASPSVDFTMNKASRWAIPSMTCYPPPSNSIPDPDTRSLVMPDIQISPGATSARIWEATLTAGPRRRPFDATFAVNALFYKPAARLLPHGAWAVLRVSAVRGACQKRTDMASSSRGKSGSKVYT